MTTRPRRSRHQLAQSTETLILCARCLKKKTVESFEFGGHRSRTAVCIPCVADLANIWPAAAARASRNR